MVPRRAVDDELGMTLVELLVGMMITVLVLALGLTVFVSTTRTEVHTEQDSRALLELRTAADRLTREMREARLLCPLIGAETTADTVRFWVDADFDNLDACVGTEQVVWRIRSGALERTSAAGGATVDRAAENLQAGSQFNYSYPTPVSSPTSEVTTIGVILVADVDADRYADERRVETEIRLRGASGDAT